MKISDLAMLPHLHPVGQLRGQQAEERSPARARSRSHRKLLRTASQNFVLAEHLA
jgi:hypothetical protein